MRFTSHLDLHRAWERTFRRAGLPLAYSQGFHPHPRLNLASALPLGFTGENEVIDAWLEQELSLVAIEQALRGALPPGLRLVKIEAVSDAKPSLQVELGASEYEITLLAPAPDLSNAVQSILAAESLVRSRREKSYDLRPLILEIQLISADGEGCAHLRAVLAAREGATGRPEELLAALGVDPTAARYQRTRLIFQQED